MPLLVKFFSPQIEDCQPEALLIFFFGQKSKWKAGGSDNYHYFSKIEKVSNRICLCLLNFFSPQIERLSGGGSAHFFIFAKNQSGKLEVLFIIFFFFQKSKSCQIEDSSAY